MSLEEPEPEPSEEERRAAEELRIFEAEGTSDEDWRNMVEGQRVRAKHPVLGRIETGTIVGFKHYRFSTHVLFDSDQNRWYVIKNAVRPLPAVQEQ